ncbi:hypothetical protein B0A55_08460 [Friedmanniomyces simplex]|uniref:AB hydrolase-1 domain-containing protein n=1 Tax=Friedmanniomyces simplex TaxID=329884 RepID=A0A4U0WY80_9PEZI|nr:hypothetical protein B0A55_08460 [Friedmanniomyces simplex]
MPATPPTIVIAHAAFHQPAHYIDFTAALDEVGLTEYRIPQLPSSSLSPPAEDAFAQDVALRRPAVVRCPADLPQATERDHAKVLGVVFVAGMVPEAGESLAKAMKTGVASWVRTEGNICTAGDPATVLFNTLHDKAALTEALEHLRPQSLSSFTSPAKTASWSQYPCAYIKCTQDNSTSLVDQEHMIEKLRRHCQWKPTVAELNSDHVPFLSMPEKLADMVKRLVADAD